MLKSHYKPSFTIVLSLIAAFFLSGCNMMPGTSTETNNNAATASNSSNKAAVTDAKDTEANAASKCFNEYYPLSSTIVRSYNITGTTKAAYTLKQSDITDEGFSEQRDFDSGIHVNNAWICTDEGLRTAEYTNSVAFDKSQFDFQTISSSGTTLPRVWEVGKEWDNDFKIKADMNVGPTRSPLDGEVKITQKILSLDESVTVGGQEYKAARLDAKITISLMMKGNKIPGITVSTKNWYAKGVGLIKQEADSGFGKQSTEYVGSK